MAKKIKKAFIIPIFIPHQGCPNRCVFCRQKTITNSSWALPGPEQIAKTIDEAMKSNRVSNSLKVPRQVAFYGGTFSSVPFDSMKAMLSAVTPYMEKGMVDSIRISTRPDSLDEQRIETLKSFGVSIVELGVQSMDDNVLRLSKRGHTSLDTVLTIKKLQENGFMVGVQLMPGLPGGSRKTFIETLQKVKSLKPNMARIYPTLVIRRTELEQLYKAGRYIPMDIDYTIDLCKEACIILEDAGIPVIRIGLMSSPSLLKKGEIVAGPWHPSMGFLVRSAVRLERIRPSLERLRGVPRIKISASSKDLQMIIGHKRRGIEYIELITGSQVKGMVRDESIPPGRVAFEIA